MYCPKCATQNMENAKFCRACGADVSLVPAALTGRFASEEGLTVEGESVPERRKEKKKKDKPTYEKAFENIGVGLAFLIISVLVALYMPAGRIWWFWLLIPSFACFGEGIGMLVRIRRELPHTSSTGAHAELPHAAPRINELPPRNTSEIMAPPPSVTEGTTRHLGAEAPTRNIRTPVENQDQ